ncbi:cation-transporting P-type ATPase [Streptomyces sp. NPDC046727]|uniref:cation-transporting P-type ATPase n=1 Tax=Streptomyces sp. NPDC046727 TaxID=3155373 RepID=UPI0033E696BB
MSGLWPRGGRGAPGSCPRGLTGAEAAGRLAVVGENTSPHSRTPSWPLRWVRGLCDPSPPFCSPRPW